MVQPPHCNSQNDETIKSKKEKAEIVLLRFILILFSPIYFSLLIVVVPAAREGTTGCTNVQANLCRTITSFHLINLCGLLFFLYSVFLVFFVFYSFSHSLFSCRHSLDGVVSVEVWLARNNRFWPIRFVIRKVRPVFKINSFLLKN